LVFVQENISYTVYNTKEQIISDTIYNIKNRQFYISYCSSQVLSFLVGLSAVA